MRYRTKLALAFSLIALGSIGVAFLLALIQGYRELKDQRVEDALHITRLLALDLASRLLDDDLWGAFEAVTRFDPVEVVVLDREGRIYVTDRPQNRELLGRPLEALGGPYEGLRGAGPSVVERDGGLFVVVPIASQGVTLGAVIARYALAPLHRRLATLAVHTAAYALVLVGILLPLGWWLGGRMVRPLHQLRRCMGMVGRVPLEGIHCRLTASRDEIGALARAFTSMLEALKEKALMEKRMMEAERLAALGRFAAGIAHELNNPLGGMLNALSTYRRHGQDPRVAEKTFALLERGLWQMRNILQALLGEARVGDRELGPEDLDDVFTLVGAYVKKKGVHLKRSCPLDHALPLPATQVRQVLINLLLNAAEAVPPGGCIAVRCQEAEGYLHLEVEDDGPGIPRERHPHLFEPFHSGKGGSGMGLWMSYRIVSQLGGRIEVEDREPGALFRVVLPCRAEEVS